MYRSPLPGVCDQRSRCQLNTSHAVGDNNSLGGLFMNVWDQPLNVIRIERHAELY